MLLLLRPWLTRGFADSMYDTRNELHVWITPAGRQALERDEQPPDISLPDPLLTDECIRTYDSAYYATEELFRQFEDANTGEIGPIPWMASPGELRGKPGPEMKIAQALQAELIEWTEPEGQAKPSTRRLRKRNRK
jgi:hypothetical protein